jgi:hypothetical protein
LVNVAVQSGMLALMCRQVADQYARSGYPKPEEWPDTPEQKAELARRVQMAEAMAAEIKERGEPAYVGMPGELPWTVALRGMTSAYLDWCQAIVDAVGLVTAAAPWLDGGEKRPTETISNRMRMDILALGGSCHPIEVGPEGRMLVSPTPKPLTKHFGHLVQRIESHKASLRVWAEPAMPPKRRGRRKRPVVKIQKGLTPIETATVIAVGNHGGNCVAAAEELGRDPSTVRENWARAQRKLANIKEGGASVRAKRLPTDKRGGEAVEDKRDTGRAESDE